MNTLRLEELHDLDETSQVASEIEAGWSGRVTRMRQAVQSVTWPEELQEGADALEATLIELEGALEEEDLEAVKELAAQAHEEWHELEHDAYAFAAGEEHEEGEGDHEEGEEASPEATGE
jgi:hypothetical protein